jgi:predicted DNA-binding antitoxin AbrB/MazE fold protein
MKRIRATPGTPFDSGTEVNGGYNPEMRGEVLMTQIVRAVYENGVLRPLEKLVLREHEQVQISVHSSAPANVEQKPDGSPRDPLEGLRIATGVSDLAENFDDYRFGRRQP